MRFFLVLLASLIALPAFAQEQPVKKKPAAKKTAPAKKTAAAKKAAHQKPTPEQIRKFNDLEKKQK